LITQVNGLGLLQFAAALAYNAAGTAGTALIIDKLHHFLFPDFVQGLRGVVALFRGDDPGQFLAVCGTARQHQQGIHHHVIETFPLVQTLTQQAQDMVDEAEIRGKKRAREIIEKAEEESERVRDRKLAEVAQAKKEAANELRNQVATISLLAAGKLIEEKLDDKKHEELIIKYIDSLNQEKLGEVK